MIPRRFPRLSAIWKERQFAAPLFAVLLVLLALPWTGVINPFTELRIAGIPAGYFLSAFLLPLAGIGVLSLYIRVAENIDRHDPELENE